MTALEFLTRINARIEMAVDRSIHRHPLAWIITTSVLIVAVALLAWRAA